MSSWDRTENVLALPSGRLVRGRSLCGGRVDPTDQLDSSAADVELILLGSRRQFADTIEGPQSARESRWVEWPDFRLPTDHRDAALALLGLWSRAESSRVGVACSGGRGRTGTALACLAVVDGVPADDAVSFVRDRYSPKAVETPWQRRFVTQFPALLSRVRPD
ncbi:protein-tyrosine phosphatase family protein [Brevibacterium sp. FAM 25378]|uniref:protein-tyrosine phosphatase family protein n=1 Tax=unclassified Brevibacterium TaxID=2614124 RepID=UPI0010919E52|nr:protein-tyrosine phosphatase family protein [Brevibacterium sp. S22]TGD31112.1 protein phosphatase [Brevibacterium sp. S22]